MTSVLYKFNFQLTNYGRLGDLMLIMPGKNDTSRGIPDLHVGQNKNLAPSGVHLQ